MPVSGPDESARGLATSRIQEDGGGRPEAGALREAGEGAKSTSKNAAPKGGVFSEQEAKRRSLEECCAWQVWQ
jgi:hypothetical protein